MATVYAEFGVQKSWTSNGVEDILALIVPPSESRRGIQIGIVGVDLNAATVKATVPPGIQQTVTIESGSGNSALVGKDWEMTRIEISGVAAGSYNYYFSYP